MDTVEKLIELLYKPKRVVVIPHINPDGDALGSCLGWAQYLELKGHHATIIAPNGFPEFYNWLPEAEGIVLFSENTEKSNQALKEADVIFCLDYNDLKRIGYLADRVEHTLKTYSEKNV